MKSIQSILIPFLFYQNLITKVEEFYEKVWNVQFNIACLMYTWFSDRGQESQSQIRKSIYHLPKLPPSSLNPTPALRHLNLKKQKTMNLFAYFIAYLLLSNGLLLIPPNDYFANSSKTIYFTSILQIFKYHEQKGIPLWIFISSLITNQFLLDSIFANFWKYHHQPQFIPGT